MPKTMRIIAVKKPVGHAVMRKRRSPELDPDNLDLVVDVVNRVTKKRAAERSEQVYRERLCILQRREREVKRREQKILRREQEYQTYRKLVHRALDAALIIFSIIGMVTTVWFCLSL